MSLRKPVRFADSERPGNARDMNCSTGNFGRELRNCWPTGDRNRPFADIAFGAEIWIDTPHKEGAELASSEAGRDEGFVTEPDGAGDGKDFAGEVAFLRDQLQKNIQSFYAKRSQNRKLAFGLKLSVVILGSIATIFLGIKSYFPNKDSEWLTALALVITASVPILVTWETFFNYRWLWVRYTSTLNNLYSISDDLEYAMSRQVKLSKKEVDELYERLQAALQETNTDWLTKRLEDDKKEKGEGRQE